MATSASLLHWIRGMLQVRSRHPVFGLGDFEVVSADNDDHPGVHAVDGR